MPVWVWIVGVFLLCGGGSWVAETVRKGQVNRHERRIEWLRAEERRISRLEAARRAPEPVCGCGHHLSQHDRRGVCHEVVRRPTGWDADQTPTGYEPGACTCQRYVGPQPLSQVYADELTDAEPELPEREPGRETGPAGGPGTGGGTDGDDDAPGPPGARGT
ncbi:MULTISPECIES: hypothetical protein [unclassified Streptomyces]|uniref:hypothetical protein n=1 Tax=unclassified Streptomyces TaxID=2593676 RepID=UPI0027E3CEE4|nr:MULTISPECIES: hypothetical protein [unclassified Streptomyces]